MSNWEHYWATANALPSEPLHLGVLEDTIAALHRQAEAESARRAQPGYCQHQDIVLHPADAARIDGKLCPFGCGRILRGPAS